VVKKAMGLTVVSSSSVPSTRQYTNGAMAVFIVRLFQKWFSFLELRGPSRPKAGHGTPYCKQLGLRAKWAAKERLAKQVPVRPKALFY